MHLMHRQHVDGVGVLEAIVTAGSSARVGVIVSTIDVPRDLLSPGDNVESDGDRCIADLAIDKNVMVL
jgi:hypothetical protein